MARAGDNITRDALSARQTTPLALVAMFGALSTVLIDPMIGLPVAGAALAGMVFGKRTSLALVVSVIAGISAGMTVAALVPVLTGDVVAVSETYALTAITIASLLAVGPMCASLIRKASAVGTTAMVAGALTVLSVAELALYAQQAGQSVGAYVDSVMRGLATDAGLAEELVEAVVARWPGALVVQNVLVAVLVVAAVGFVGARLEVSLRRFPPLASLDLDARMVLLPIAAMVLLAAGRLPLGSAPILELAGTNVLIVARLVFFMQGFAVFAGLYRKGNVSRTLRIIGFVSLAATELIAPLVSLTGLADVWINIRRLPREGSSMREPKTPPGVD